MVDYGRITRRLLGATHLSALLGLILTSGSAAAPAQLDPGFSVGTGASSTVWDVAYQADGAVWIGGEFSTVNSVSRYGVAKLLPTGALDPSFTQPTYVAVRVIAPLSGGKILIGMDSIGSGATYRVGIARLNADGSIDTSFGVGSPINSTVYAIEVMPDGKILVGGSFSKGVARLNADGTADPTFAPVTGTSGTIWAIQPQASGKIVIGGSFSSYDGVSRSNLCRLNANGSMDTSFGSTNSGPSSTVYDIEPEPDGQLLIAGGFSSFNNITQKYLARVADNGIPDPYFLPEITSTLYSVASMADGRMLVGGDFTTINSVARQRFAVLHADGKPDTTFDSSSGASSSVRKVRVRPDGKFLIGGAFTTVATVSSKGVAKLMEAGSATRPAIASMSRRSALAGELIQLRGSNLANVTSVSFGGNVPALFSLVSELEISVTVPTGAQVGLLTLQNSAGTGTSLSPFYPLPVAPGALDPSFDPGSGANSTVQAISKDPAGRILIAGDFSSVNGLSRSAIARLTPDGAVDTSFSPPASSSYLRAIAIQPDGRLLVGGSSIGGKPGMARLNADGGLDNSFNSPAVSSSYVYALGLQADGKIIVGGSFTRRLTRLNPDGSQDLSFDVGTGPNSDVKTIRVQPDGKILIAGSFSTYNGSTAKMLARLTASGGIDPTFQITGTGISGSIIAMALQKDGGIVVGGSFYSINGKSTYARLARFRPDGSLDDAFVPAVDSTVNAVEVMLDGRIAIGGDFTAVKGMSRNYSALLLADGALATGFNTTGGPSSTIYAVLPGAGGSLTIGGGFNKVAGQAPAYIARLAGDDGKCRPAAVGMTPTSGVTGQRVAISGSNLGSLTAAEFGGGKVAAVFPISETLTEVEVPSGAMSGPITLRNAFGQTSTATIFKLLSNPVPVITSIPSGPVAIGSTFTVIGKNFYDVTAVRIGVLTAVFTVSSATEMTVTVPALALTSRVVLSGPGGTVQSAVDLQVVKALPAITSAASANGVIGQSFSFTIKATNYPTGFSASPLPPGLLVDAGSGLVTGIPTAAGVFVSNLTATNEGGTTTGSLTITISVPPPPVVNSVYPAYVPTGGKILVAGDFLLQTTSVTVGGVAAVFEILSDDRLAVVMPAGVTTGVVAVTTLQGTITSTAGVDAWDFLAGSQIVTGFGDNSSGQRTAPAGLNDVTAIAAGQSHSLALSADGRVTGWGSSWSGQATPPVTLAPAAAIAAGGNHSLALQVDGTIAAWGRDDEAQCTGATSLANIAAIAAGGFHSLALTGNGSVKAWGANWSGQTSVPTSLGGVVAIAAGGDFSVALKSDGTVVAWGDNSSGQTDVPATATGIISITAGVSHVVALKSDGTVVCWGANWSRQCTPPAGLGQVVQISARGHHTIALRADGTCAAWGASWSGQAAVPSGVIDAAGVAGGGDYSLILHAATPVPRVTVPLIANGKPGQAFSLTPVAENGPFLFTAEGLPAGLAISPQTGAISGTPTAGGDFIITLTARNGYGIARQNLRLLIGPYIIGWGTSVPGPIPKTLSNIVQVAAGASHCLALLNNGTVSGWGSNSYGETTIPAGLTEIIAIAAGDHFSLALKSNGTVYGWGRNPAYPYLWTSPVATNVVAIDANAFTATALMNNGTAKTIVSESSFYRTYGTDLIGISSLAASYFSSFYGNIAAINRSGFIVSDDGFGISSSAGFDRLAISASRGSSNEAPYWGIQRDGKLYEIQTSRYSSSQRTQILRPETPAAADVAAGNLFALVLNADASATVLTATPDPDYPSPTANPPQLTTDTLVQVGAIAARLDYALAVKDATARSRFISQRITEARAGQTFAHQLVVSGGSPTFSTALLPVGLSINPGTGLISGSPTGVGTFDFLVIARFSTYFITQVVSVKISQGVAPVDMTLSTATVVEALPVGSPVGTLAALDYSPADTFTYSLVTGPGSTDNSNFKITGNQLLTNSVLDYESKPQRSVRIQVTDSGRNTFAKVFQITVTGVTTDDDDQDGLTQAEEAQLGTDRNLRDSDQDGAGDGQEISAGTNPLSAASKPANYVAAWGLNNYGQSNVPANLGPVIGVAAGKYHTLALRADGTVAAWGLNNYGQCDVPSGLQNVTALAAGYSHSVALKADGSVVCWGSSSSDLNTTPAGLANVVEISAGEYHTAALKADGQVVVWGSTSYDVTIVPAAASGSVQIAAGDGTVLALNRDGNTIGWGDDWQNQTSGPSNRNDLVAVAAGNDLSLGLSSDGRVHAWGWNIYEATTIPPDLDSVIQISAATYFSLALRSDGNLVSWGNKSNHQGAVPVGIGPVQMALGGYGHVVALVGNSAPKRFLTSTLKAVTGLPVARQLSFSGTADRFTAMGLPDGLEFDSVTGTISGTPTQQGTFNVRFTAEQGFSRITKIIPFISEPVRRFEEWALAEFPTAGPGSPIASALADPDGDSVCNLLEYALHRDPMLAEITPPTAMSAVQVDGQNYLCLSYTSPKNVIDLRYVVEVSGNLAAWQSGPSSTAPVEITDHGDTETVTVRDTTPMSSAAPRFIRLKVEQAATN